MKLVSKNAGSKKECLDYLYEIVNQVGGDSLVLEDQGVVIPEGTDLDYKVKYTEEPGETKLTIKVKWANDIPIPEGEEAAEED